jgi:hypothetical protein
MFLVCSFMETMNNELIVTPSGDEGRQLAPVYGSSPLTMTGAAFSSIPYGCWFFSQ